MKLILSVVLKWFTLEIAQKLVLFLPLLIAVGFFSTQLFAQTVTPIGTSCTGPQSQWYWEQPTICPPSTNVWQRPAVQLGAAIASCSSSTAGMIQWTGAALQLCNGTSWNAIGSSDNLLGATATATNPHRSSDTTTGLFSDTASTMEIATAGVERLRVTATGSVGIGTTAPAGNFHILSTVDPAWVLIEGVGTVAPYITGRRANGTISTRTAAAANDNLLVLGAQGYGASSYSSGYNAGIAMKATQAFTDSARGTYITFETTASGSTTRSEAMRITDAGYVGIGANAPGALLNISKDTNPGYTYSSGTGAAPSGYTLKLDNRYYGADKFTGIAIRNDQTNGVAGYAYLGTVSAASGYPGIFVIGQRTADAAYTERLRIDASGQVGIGTTAPSAPLDVGGFVRFETGTVNNGPDIHLDAQGLIAADSTMYFNANATAPSATTVAFVWETGTLTSAASNIMGLYPTGGLYINDSSGTRHLTLTSDGFLGLNRSTTSYPIRVGSDSTDGAGAFLTAAGVWTNASDARIKKNIRPIPYGLDAVMKLNPVAYEMKKTGAKQIGLIAQEVQPIVPEVVSVAEDGRYGLSYGNLLAVAIKAIQEQQAEIAALRQEFQALKARMK